MSEESASRVAPAWYSASRLEFLQTSSDRIANQLAGRAAMESLEVEKSQAQEWHESIQVLQQNLDDRLALLRRALQQAACESIRDVVLEFDFRRRGLRLDCVLLADGALIVIEFKRTRLGRADRDQVMSYAVNLLEFHRVTREWCERDQAVIVPVLTLTRGTLSSRPSWPGLGGHSWSSISTRPLECDAAGLKEALGVALENRRSMVPMPRATWLKSPFCPSSSILDATVSLYGNHDVAAIEEHAASREAIEASTDEIRREIDRALRHGEHHVVFLSGAPGAGKTLVGLDIAMRGRSADSAVFVTGNAPLVDVLNAALEDSYLQQGRADRAWIPTGYRRADARVLSSAATFKIVKAHNFLGRRGLAHGQQDGRVLVFDEAQRTYVKGRRVSGENLPDHEADLILDVQRKAFPAGSVVVALVGHNQAINRGERGVIAWLEAAERFGWTFSISNETLDLAELHEPGRWAAHPRRRQLLHGHLRQSMRYYRNAAVEEWAGAVLDGRMEKAVAIADRIRTEGETIWITRVLRHAKTWARERTGGAQRSGLIASGQAKRLAAEGLFVDYKPDIATWMLTPSTDIRSSNALETVQNQFQIQGLELDYCIVCWDADLRRESGEWGGYRISGTDWQRDRQLDLVKNGYRVILTRARKGMVIFVPKGDLSLEDRTRDPAVYDGIFEFLIECGATKLTG